MNHDKPAAHASSSFNEADPPIDHQEITPLRLWPPSQVLAWEEPPGLHILLPAYLSRGEMTALVGQGGLGKSRLALWLAVCQILGQPWCGLETATEPVKWVFLGPENSLPRLRSDLAAMLAPLTDSEREVVDQHLLLPAQVDPGDTDSWLGSVETQARMMLTLERQRPDVVVLDPLATFSPGDTTTPGDMSEALRLIRGLVRVAAPNAAILLLHHARTGRANIAQGVGYDSANFAAGGKPLFGTVRAQLNLMPGSADDDTKLVLACAKSNNCQRFVARGLRFSVSDRSYHVDPAFDVRAWLADVEGSRASTSRLPANHVAELCGDGIPRARLAQMVVKKLGCSRPQAYRYIARAIDEGAIETKDDKMVRVSVDQSKAPSATTA